MEGFFEILSVVSFAAIRRHYPIPALFQPRAHISTLPGNFYGTDHVEEIFNTYIC